MRFPLLLIPSVLLSLAAPAVAQEEEDVRGLLEGLGYLAQEGAEAEDAFGALEAEWRAANEAWRAEVKRLRKVDKAQSRALRKQDPVADFWQRFEALDAAGEGRAVVWMALHADELGEPRKATAERKRALLARVLADWTTQPWIRDSLGELVREKRWLEEEGVRSLLTAVHERNTDAATRADAGSRLATRLLRKKGGDPERGKAILKTIVAEAADPELTANAETRLYKLEVLGTGCVAPDFETVDQHGETFRLADYRGKVVVLDFWGFW
jgi:hypothetical protein